MNQKVLIIDDEADIRELLTITLQRMNLDAGVAENIQVAKQRLAEIKFDLCLLDLRLPDGNGLEFLEYLQEQFTTMPVIMITAHGNMEAAIKALKLGAFDFLNKPIDLKQLRDVLQSALALPTKVKKTKKNTAKQLLGDSAAMQELRKMVAKVARSQAPVHIHGESGTGKELVARLIHEQGSRASQKFVAVNCGAIPTELMESEFFGHKKGSFTGAVEDKKGFFQQADNGTLFLDEVADLPLHMQVKLLRAIQEKKVRPVGGEEIDVDIRILSATHKSLAEQVNEKLFREDLFYRINVIELYVPALIERKEDIKFLVDFFLAELSERNQIDIPILTKNALNKLSDYSFPGNVRELENILERALALYDDNQIDVRDLGLKENTQANADKDNQAREKIRKSIELETQTEYIDQTNLNQDMDAIEKERIVKALEQTRWNKTKAAKLLGITLRQLRYRLDKLNI